MFEGNKLYIIEELSLSKLNCDFKKCAILIKRQKINNSNKNLKIKSLQSNNRSID